MIDVIVVGAGPAGSSAARVLAKSGWNVLVIEKEKMPRHKHCAGVISNRTYDLLAEQGIDCSIAIEQEYYGGIISFRDLEVQIFVGEKICAGAYREKFDHLLAIKAEESGAEIVNEVVTRVISGKDSVEVLTKKGSSRKARVVLGADGVHSVVRNSIGIPLEKEKLALTLEAELKIPTEKIDQIYGDYQHIDLGYMDAGYVWAFPKRKGGTINVGLGYPLTEYDKLSEQPKNILKRFIDDRKIVDKVDMKFHTAMMPYLGTCSNVGKDQVLLLGDAAGFVDPILGDGISYALESGILAGKTCDTFLTEGGNLVHEYMSSVKHIMNEINDYGMKMYKYMHGDENRRKNMIKICATDRRIATIIMKIFSKKINYKQALKKLSSRRLIIPFIRSWYLSKKGKIDKKTQIEVSI